MATKIVDGLFLGDLESAHDVDFLVSNKVTHIINCCGRGGNGGSGGGRRSRNGGPRNAGNGGGYGYNNKPWERIGIKYLVYHWQSSTTFDGSEDNVEMFSSFIDAALGECTSVLVHSRDGASRACAVVASYLMKRLLWGVEQMLEYLRVKRHDLNPTLPVRRQLFEIQRRMEAKYSQNDRILRRLTIPSWTFLEPGMEVHFQNEVPVEINTIVNTHVNSLQPREVPRPRAGDGSHRLTWIDSGQQSSSVNRSRRGGSSRGGDQRGKPTPARPPGTSYNSTKPENGWIDTMSQQTGGSSSGGGQRNPYVRYDDGRRGGAAQQPTKFPNSNGLSNGGGFTTLRPCLKSAATRDHDRVGAAAALAEAAALAAETASSSDVAGSESMLEMTTSSTTEASLITEEGSTNSPARWRTDMIKSSAATSSPTPSPLPAGVNVGVGTGMKNSKQGLAAITSEGTTIATTQSDRGTSAIGSGSTTEEQAGSRTTQWGVPSGGQETVEFEPKKLPVSNVASVWIQSSWFYIISEFDRIQYSHFFFLCFLCFLFFNCFLITITALTSDEATKTWYTRYSGCKSTTIETPWCCRCVDKRYCA